MSNQNTTTKFVANWNWADFQLENSDFADFEVDDTEFDERTGDHYYFNGYGAVIKVDQDANVIAINEDELPGYYA